MSDFSALGRFKPENTTVVAKSSEKAPKAFRWGGNGTIVAFDQSLANTGYIVAEVTKNQLSVVASGVIGTVNSGGRKSWTDTLYRARELIKPIRAVIAEYQPVMILHEMPPISNSRSMHRPDSSILSALAIWVAAGDLPIRMVDARTVKRHLTGRAGATKKEVRTALESRLGAVLDDKHLRKNEHTFDALGILYTYLTKEHK